MQSILAGVAWPSVAGGLRRINLNTDALIKPYVVPRAPHHAVKV